MVSRMKIMWILLLLASCRPMSDNEPAKPLTYSEAPDIYDMAKYKDNLDEEPSQSQQIVDNIAEASSDIVAMPVAPTPKMPTLFPLTTTDKNALGFDPTYNYNGYYFIGDKYSIKGEAFRPMEAASSFAENGSANIYPSSFEGQLTASGEVYDGELPSAAHPTLPLPSIVMVHNLATDKRIKVRVNDRGAFPKDIALELSPAAAKSLGIKGGEPISLTYDYNATEVMINHHTHQKYKLLRDMYQKDLAGANVSDTYWKDIIADIKSRDGYNPFADYKPRPLTAYVPKDNVQTANPVPPSYNTVAPKQEVSKETLDIDMQPTNIIQSKPAAEVVAVAPLKIPAAEAAFTGAKKRVLAFMTKDYNSAVREQNKLTKKFKSQIERTGKGFTLAYKVVLSGFATEAAASSALLSAQKMGYGDAVLIP
jgi:rare lipoprotein A (peptidoglycan hydrolase)